jgi:hypothetical protein
VADARPRQAAVRATGEAGLSMNSARRSLRAPRLIDRDGRHGPGSWGTLALSALWGVAGSGLGADSGLAAGRWPYAACGRVWSVGTDAFSAWASAVAYGTALAIDATVFSRCSRPR